MAGIWRRFSAAEPLAPPQPSIWYDPCVCHVRSRSTTRTAKATSCTARPKLQMETAMEMTIQAAKTSLAPNRFVCEVEEFRETIANPSLTLDEKKRAYGLIVKHAALLDPEDAGFWRAGVALKVALCAWLDFRPMLEH
jgi:hypothetical protein